MGRAAIILVVGTAVILGIFGRATISRSSDASKSAYRYYTKTVANNIAASGVELYLNKLRNDPSLARGTYNESMLGGTAKNVLDTCSPKSSRVFLAIGTFQGTVDTIRSYCDSATAGSITVNAAVSFSKGATGGSWIFNNTDIDGRNYNYSTGALDASSPTLHGFTKENNGVGLTFNNGGVTGSGGGPTPRDTVSLGGSQMDFNTLPNQLYPKATRVLSSSPTYASVTWGTHAAPEITFITSTVIVNTSCSGEGILVVAGNFNCNGSLNWKGLVIFCQKDASWPGSSGSVTVLTTLLGVYGAVINVGDNVSYTANSSGNYIHYSKSSIDYVCSKLGIGGGGTNTKFVIRDWYD